MEEAAKEAAKHVFTSNVGAVVAMGVFAVFVAGCLYLVLTWMGRRDDAMMAKFAEIQRDTAEKMGRVEQIATDRNKAIAERFAEVTVAQHQSAKEQHEALERISDQSLSLLKDTIETMAGVAHSVGTLESAVNGLEKAVGSMQAQMQTNSPK